ncbi:hypothetical protein [Adhaeribacter pallidiroseus]|uniref:hypothetical protein n=1 Tax=Adhaeribacter pallidiroseus TaxID=2072847 RepID=UPI001314CF11|nr:hypothetical protein [Adhaeribacter pallidiroseus]
MNYAVEGNKRAAKLYFDVIGKLNLSDESKPAVINQQNNYIQLNSISISQNTVKQL